MSKSLKRIMSIALVLALAVPQVITGALNNQDVNTTTEETIESIDREGVDEIGEEDIESQANDEVITEDMESTFTGESDDAISEVEEEAHTTASTEIEYSQEYASSGDVYEVETVEVEVPITTYSVMSDYDRYMLEREEVQLMTEEKTTYDTLVTKTDSEYEVAIANSDGSYTFVDDTNNINDAINEADNIPSDRMRSDSMPVVINSKGQVVYSAYSMARVWKHIGGQPYSGNDKNTNLYSDSGLKYTDNYINHGYVSDLPILAFNGTTSAKVMVSGYTGWANMNTNASEYDILVYPVNQITNPSHYYVQNGILYHFIASNPTREGSGYALEIGKAPSYLKSGTKYFSYDGNYFYSGSTTVEGLTKLIIDYQAGTRENSINANEVYYSYYQTLPFRSETMYTASELDSFINAKTSSTSKLRNTGAALKSAEEKYGVNALLALGVAINESGWGMSSIAQSKNNIFGLNAIDSNPGLAANEFPTVAACIEDFAKNWISGGYADPSDWRYNGGFLGDKGLGANVRYASDPYWAEKAARYAFQIDLYLSGNINELQDTDQHQLAVFNTTERVITQSGSTIYDVKFDEIPVVIAEDSTVKINNEEHYRIYPERTLPVSSGNYDGNYNWNYKGYAPADSIDFINEGTNGPNTLTVLGGDTRYETAVELSKSRFTTADTVVIVNYLAIIDGITASALATAAEAPILLAAKSSIPESVEEEIERLGAKNAIFIGGTGVLDSTLANKLRNMGLLVTRIGGDNRYETALEVAKYIDKNYYDVEQVLVVNGLGEADALSAGPISGQNKMPIILTPSASLNWEVEEWLASESLKTGYVIGGSAVVSDKVLNELNAITTSNVLSNRLGGANRYETNAQIIEEFYGSKVNHVYVTKGLVLADALTAGPIAALNNSPIVISDNGLTTSQVDVLSNIEAKGVIQAGLGVNEKAIETLLTILK